MPLIKLAVHVHVHHQPASEDQQGPASICCIRGRSSNGDGLSTKQNAGVQEMDTGACLGGPEPKRAPQRERAVED